MAEETPAGVAMPENPATPIEPQETAVVDETPPAAPERTFTQAELDTFLARQKRQLLAGADDVAQLREKAKRLDELEEQSKTELERERDRAARAEEELTRIRETAQQQLIQAAVLSEATKQKALKPEHMHRLIDLDTVTVGDDGQVIGAEDAVKAFLESNPEYVGRPQAPAGSADQGARPSAQITEADLAKMTPEAIDAAHREGRLDHLLRVR